MGKMWDDKYNSDKFIYGTNPNQFFKEYLSISSPGSLLLPGEGEGRNAVFAAQQGWQVDAFDTSNVGRQKALNFAKKKEVSITYGNDAYLTFKPADKYDLVGLFYTHMPSETRAEFHKRIPAWLKKDGVLILEAFDKKQLNLSSGGPKDIDMLFREKDLLNDFKGMKVVKSETTMVSLDEGDGHKGEAHVIRLILKKIED